MAFTRSAVRSRLAPPLIFDILISWPNGGPFIDSTIRRFAASDMLSYIVPNNIFVCRYDRCPAPLQKNLRSLNTVLCCGPLMLAETIEPKRMTISSWL